MGENNKGLHWMDVRGLSFNTMLLLEKVHFKWLPLCGVSKWGRRELGIAFRENPSVLWYAVNICPEVSKWINDLVNEVKDVDLDNEAHEYLLKNNYSWSRFEEPGDGIKRKYWKTVC